MSDGKSIKKSKLTPTQAKVVRAKIKAELNDLPIKAVANDVYPNMKPESARVEVQKALQNPTVQEVLYEAMRQHGLTPDTLAGTVGDAMRANKVVQLEGDFYETEVPDHGIRLRAAGLAGQWMGVGKGGEAGPTNFNFINISNSDKDAYKLS